MKLSETVEGLKEDLSKLAGLGGDAVAAAAANLADAIGGPATIRLLDLLGEAAAELGAQLPSGRVEVRISGRDAELVYVDEAGLTVEADLGEDQSARISLRLPEQLKILIDQAAGREGVSTNTWIVRVLSRSAPAAASPRSHKRLSGYGWA